MWGGWGGITPPEGTSPKNFDPPQKAKKSIFTPPQTEKFFCRRFFLEKKNFFPKKIFVSVFFLEKKFFSRKGPPHIRNFLTPPQGFSKKDPP